MSGNKETLVEEGTTVKGSIESQNPIVVRGRLEGEASGPSMHVSSSGHVSGTVVVKELISEGSIEGEFDADVAQLSGEVKDKTTIRAREIDVRLSSGSGKVELVFGNVALEVGEVPDKAAALASAKQANQPTTDPTEPAHTAPSDEQPAEPNGSEPLNAEAASPNGKKAKKGKRKHAEVPPLN